MLDAAQQRRLLFRLPDRSLFAGVAGGQFAAQATHLDTRRPRQLNQLLDLRSRRIEDLSPGAHVPGSHAVGGRLDPRHLRLGPAQPVRELSGGQICGDTKCTQLFREPPTSRQPSSRLRRDHSLRSIPDLVDELRCGTATRQASACHPR